ncbi:Tyrosine recombinase XerC [bioreactor metagenome]|uniref:Tyrosine recombinase XerC n=1 Tax=bioreactor metagenome TaxID=1076179 RepID=A0A644U7X7_9ZZZZ|nr:tyrosine-type recombinase/integrase [Negativicutes bacterium]
MAGTKKYPGVEPSTATTFKLTITDGYTVLSDGTKKQNRYFKTVNAKSAKEASDLRAQWITEIKGGAILTNNRMTLKQFYDYFKTHTEGLAPKSIEFYNGLFKRVDAALGHKKLDDITPNNIRAFIKNLAEDGLYSGTRKNKSKLSQSTILKYHRMLNMLFNRACKWGLASFNPCERTDAPKVYYRQKNVYTEDELGKFLLCLEKESIKHRAMAMITLATGCRRGETMGLQWKHINFEAGTINIEQTAQYLSGKGVFTKEPKTQGSNRIVTMPESISTLLKSHKANQNAKRLKFGDRWAGSEIADDDFVFTTWEGKQAHPDSINTWLKKFITNNDLPPITPKSFRHMAATYLITSGTDIRTVAGKLGHANTNTTTIVYTHLLKSSEKETADKMEKFLQEASKKAKETQKEQAK